MQWISDCYTRSGRTRPWLRRRATYDVVRHCAPSCLLCAMWCCLVRVRRKMTLTSQSFDDSLPEPVRSRAVAHDGRDEYSHAVLCSSTFTALLASAGGAPQDSWEDHASDLPKPSTLERPLAGVDQPDASVRRRLAPWPLTRPWWPCDPWAASPLATRPLGCGHSRSVSLAGLATRSLCRRRPLRPGAPSDAAGRARTERYASVRSHPSRSALRPAPRCRVDARSISRSLHPTCCSSIQALSTRRHPRRRTLRPVRAQRHRHRQRARQMPRHQP